MPSEMKMGTINPFREENWHILQYYGGKLHFLLHFQYEGGTEKQIFTKYHSCKWGTNIQHIPILFTCADNTPLLMKFSLLERII